MLHVYICSVYSGFCNIFRISLKYLNTQHSHNNKTRRLVAAFTSFAEIYYRNIRLGARLLKAGTTIVNIFPKKKLAGD